MSDAPMTDTLAAHAAALERERIAAWLDRQARGMVLSLESLATTHAGDENARAMRDLRAFAREYAALARDIRNGAHNEEAV